MPLAFGVPRAAALGDNSVQASLGVSRKPRIYCRYRRVQRTVQKLLGFMISDGSVI